MARGQKLSASFNKLLAVGLATIQFLPDRHKPFTGNNYIYLLTLRIAIFYMVFSIAAHKSNTAEPTYQSVLRRT